MPNAYMHAMSWPELAIPGQDMETTLSVREPYHFKTSFMRGSQRSHLSITTSYRQSFRTSSHWL